MSAQAISLWGVLGVPLAAAIACAALPRPRHVLGAVSAVSAVEFALALAIAGRVESGGAIEAAGAWLRVDALSAVHLVVLGAVFLIASLFAGMYFPREHREHAFTRARARRFGALWMGSLAAMALVLVSNNLGMMWVGMEATTLLTAFLISLHSERLSLEAMWKYLIICSVGIAFAFMGTLLTAAAVRTIGAGADATLLWSVLAAPATRLDPTLMKVAFAFLVVGYGTKAGLAPVHSWLPDAHSQAPAPVSAMFSGFLLNTALYAVVRYLPLVTHAAGGGFASTVLLVFGSLSIVIAAAFIVFQHDAKRLLAYHSVEHLGIIALGYGLGPLGAFAAVYHTVNHALCKSLAFFAVGRLGQRFGTHDMRAMGGALAVDRLWGGALLVSLLALIGVAPFAVFMSEYQLLRAAIEARAWVPLGLFLAGGTVVFVAALRHLIDIVYGPPRTARARRDEGPLAPGLVFATAAALVVLGLWLPAPVRDLFDQAARIVTRNP